MARIEAPSLRDYVANTSAQKAFCDPVFSVTVADLNRGTSLGGLATDLAGPFSTRRDSTPAHNGIGAH